LCQEDFNNWSLSNLDTLSDQKMRFELLERAVRDLEELQMRTVSRPCPSAMFDRATRHPDGAMRAERKQRPIRAL
jgi:hypothetical protein